MDKLYDILYYFFIMGRGVILGRNCVIQYNSFIFVK